MRCLPICLLILLTLPLPGQTQTADSASSVATPAPAVVAEQPKPIDISADQLELRQQQGRAVFRQNVKVLHDGMTLTAETLEVYYSDGKVSGGELGGNIERVIAQNNVHILLPGNETIDANTATYRPAEKQLELTGSVVLNQNGNSLKGEKLVYDLSSGLASLTADPSQGVKARFVPEND